MMSETLDRISAQTKTPKSQIVFSAIERHHSILGAALELQISPALVRYYLKKANKKVVTEKVTRLVDITENEA